MKYSNFEGAANFLFEAGILAKTPRSGFHFLGSGEQSVAEHVNRVTYVGFTMAMMDGTVDVGKVIQMCMFHDFAEGRTSDLNYVHQKYVQADEEKALTELAKTLEFGDAIMALMNEYKERKTQEALIAKDADQIEFILSLKEQADIGNPRASEWIQNAIKRLKTDIAKQLAEKILSTRSDAWWYTEKDGDWWVNRNGGSAKRF
ncbi:MAG: HD domain-containing protein [Patescibacteria group bacterium]